MQFVNGTPALGIGATVYFDPSQSPIMTGTDWLKGDMALDVSYPPENSCFSFDFDSAGTGSGVSVGDGVFTATEFSINVAPTGCTVGPYVVPRGASMTFNAELGDGTVYMDLAIGTNDDGPYASGDFSVNNIVIGGTTFKTMQLSVYESAVETDVSFVGDFILPVGTFNGDFTLTADTSQLYMSGDVELTDWQLAGNSFDVEEMSFSTTISVPFGEGTCSSWSDTTTSGLMSMGQKTKLSFDGQLAMGDCRLQILMFEYEYQHGGVTEEFRIDYDAATYLLAGGAFFQFQRDTSWKFLSHRYRRHPNFAIGLSFSMDVRYPSSATMTLGGTVSVANGSGTIVCTFSGGTGDPWADDQCTLDVYINILGNHHYHADW